MARVWREGQKKRVWIYRLLTTGSLEEKVWQRQLAKQGLSKSIVDDGGKEGNRQFSADEMRQLFTVSKATCTITISLLMYCKTFMVSYHLYITDACPNAHIMQC
jgi:DNA repair and recombination protein RAD54B